MAARDEQVIGLSKKKILLVVLGSWAFVALGVWFLSLEEATIRAQRRFNDPLLIQGVGVVTILCFGTAGLYGIRKWFDKRPGLVLSSLGIVDNSSAVAAGEVPWSEIVGTSIFERHEQKMLVVRVRDPQRYIERGGWAKRALKRANHKMCGSPIVVTPNALKIGFEELLSLFEAYRRRYGAPRPEAPAPAAAPPQETASPRAST